MLSPPPSQPMHTCSMCLTLPRYDWPWWMKLQNTRIKDGKVQLGELTGGKMDDITGVLTNWLP